ncbi:MAG TPA: hypothetical protein VGS12_01990 [Caulobacteraceae bacterium]|nr:hypothetical protein [Caulobacteraceae bacterium]
MKWIAAFGAGMQMHFEDLALHLAGKERCNSDQRMDQLMPLYEKQGVAAHRGARSGYGPFVA